MRATDLVAEYVESRRSIRGDLSPKTIQGYFDSARFVPAYWPPVAGGVTKSLQALRQLSPESERTHLRRLRTIGSYAAEKHGMPNPFLGFQPRRTAGKPKRVFTVHEYALLRNACRDIIDVAMLDVLMGTGIRIGEMPLDIWTVGPDHLLVDGKTGPRYAAITERDRATLLATQANGKLWGAKSQYRHSKRPLSLLGIRINWRRLVARAGLSGPKLGPHTARRTFASEWVRNGGSLESLKSQLGHTSVRTTEIYVKDTPGWVAAHLAKVDPLGSIRAAAEISGPNRLASGPALLPHEELSHAATS